MNTLPMDIVDIIFCNLWRLRMREDIAPLIQNTDERAATAQSIVRMTAANVGMPSGHGHILAGDFFLDYVEAKVHVPPSPAFTRRPDLQELLHLCSRQINKDHFRKQYTGKRIFGDLMTSDVSLKAMKEFVAIMYAFHPDIHWDIELDEEFEIIRLYESYKWTARHATCRCYRK